MNARNIIDEKCRDLQEQCRRDTAAIRNSAARLTLWGTAATLEGALYFIGHIPNVKTPDNIAGLFGAGITALMTVRTIGKAQKHRALLQKEMARDHATATADELQIKRAAGLEHRGRNAWLATTATFTGLGLSLGGYAVTARHSGLAADPLDVISRALHDQPGLSFATTLSLASLALAAQAGLVSLNHARCDRQYARQLANG